MFGRYLFAAIAIAILLAAPAVLAAAQTQQLDTPVFEVYLTDADGNRSDRFVSGGDLLVNIRIALVMSETRNYPTTVTLTTGPETKEIFNGSLGEGYWLITEKVRVGGGWGNPVPWKVVLRTRLVNRKEQGQTDSWYSYYKTEGTFTVK